MKIRIPNYLFVLFCCVSAFSSIPFKASLKAQVATRSFQAIPTAADGLALPSDSLKRNPVLTESVLDLVNVRVLDSTLHAKRQHHLGFPGVMARLFARYWQRLDENKRKYIGTVSREFKVFDGIAREVDVNIFLMPHLPEYVRMARSAVDKAMEKPRSRKHFRYDNPEFPSPPELEFDGLGYLTIECESTPPEKFREVLAETFFPTSSGKHDLSEHPGFGMANPSIGLYGAWCMDCNHNCRPEIHPFEWIWWLDLGEPDPSGNSKTWMVSLMRDGSGRFEDWSPVPLAGTISIPVVYRPGQRIHVSWEHLATDSTWATPLLDLEDRQGFVPLRRGKSALIQLPGNARVEMETTGAEIEGNGLKFRWVTPAMDMKADRYLVKLEMAVAVPDIYAGKLTVRVE